MRRAVPTASVRLRRAVLTALALLLLGGCGDAQTDREQRQTYRWDMLVNAAPDSQALRVAHSLAERLAGASGGRLQIDIAATDEAVFTAVSQGRAQLGHGTPGASAQFVPAATLFMSVPFGMDADQFSAWIYDGGGLQLWRELYAPHGVVPYLAGHGGQAAHLDAAQIARAGDLQESGGAQPASPPAERVVAPGQHRHHRGWRDGEGALELLVSRAALDTLPQELREILRIVCVAEAHRVAVQRTDTASVRQSAAPPSDAALDALAQRSREQLQARARQDADFARVYRSYREFLLQSLAVYEIGEDQILELQRQ